MKDDLISRKDAVSRISDLLILELKGARIPTWNEVYNAIGDVPSVPAVPMDKLCEWLAEHYGSPCQLAEIDCYPQCEPDENGECYGMRTDNKRCWHDYLTKWMEAQDAR